MLPLNIAHRGGAGLWPENTNAAFRHAAASGCDGAELDIQLSRDGRVVVTHDYRLKPEITRDPGGAWIAPPGPRIKDMTLAQLRACDIGRADPRTDYAKSHPDLVGVDGERIPTLDEVVEIAKGAVKPFTLFVEIKTSFADRAASADPVALANAAVALLRDADYLDRTIFVGFDWPGLLQVKKIAPDARCWFTTLDQRWFGDGPPPPDSDPPPAPMLEALRFWAKQGISPWAGGYDAVNYGGSILKAIRAAGGDGWFPTYTDVTRERMGEARELGLAVGAWTVDTRAEMQRLIALGLDSICTDRPDWLAAELFRLA